MQHQNDYPLLIIIGFQLMVENSRNGHLATINVVQQQHLLCRSLIRMLEFVCHTLDIHSNSLFIDWFDTLSLLACPFSSAVL